MCNSEFHLYACLNNIIIQGNKGTKEQNKHSLFSQNIKKRIDKQYTYVPFEGKKKNNIKIKYEVTLAEREKAADMPRIDHKKSDPH